MADMPRKSSVEEIRERFDNDVERFSSVETGQQAAIDSPLIMQLIADVSAAVAPRATSILDIGCGAGNYSLKLLEQLPGCDVTLIDLSRPMLDRAQQRVGKATVGRVTCMQGDVRGLPLGEARFDVVVAAAVLHHLRDEGEWRDVFAAVFRAVKPGGCFWISDMVSHEHPAVEARMQHRYADYLKSVGGIDYQQKVFAYIEKEDTPRPASWQMQLLRDVGFAPVEMLHKNSVFAAFGGIRPA